MSGPLVPEKSDREWLRTAPARAPLTVPGQPVSATSGEVSDRDWLLSGAKERADAGGQAARLGASLAPERATRVLQLRRTTDLPTDVIERNLDEVEANNARASFDPERVGRDSPVVAGWLSEHPAHMAAAKNDLGNLSLIESLTTFLGRGFKSGRAQSQTGRLGYQAMQGGGLTRDQDRTLKRLNEQITENETVLPALGADPASSFVNVLYRASQIWGQMSDAAPEAGTYGAAGLAAGAASTGILSTLGPLGTAAGVASIVPAGVVGLTFGFAKYTFQAEAGQAYLELSQIRGDQGQPLDEDLKRNVALGVGIVNALFETTGAAIIAAPFRAAARQFLKASVKDAIVRPTMRTALGQFAKSYAGAIAGETTTEVLQEGSNVIGEELAKMGSDGTFKTLLNSAEEREQAMQRLADIAQQTASGMVLVGLPGASIHGASGAYAARRASRNEQLFLALGEGVTNSTTFKNLPESVQEIVKRATQDGPIENVYAPVEQFDTYFQSAKIDPAAVADELGIRERWEEAQRTGADLAIPMPKYATVIAPTEHNAYFARILRTRPNEMNGEEARAFFDTETARAEAATEDAAAASATDVQATAIGDRIFAQLMATGAYDEPTARTFAKTLYEDVYRNLGSRVGLSPTELFARRPVTVSAGERATPAPIGARTSLEEVAARAIAVRDAQSEARAEREAIAGEEGADPYAIRSLHRDNNAKTAELYTYARDTKERLRNVEKVHTDGLIDELTTLLEQQSVDANKAVPTVLSKGNEHVELGRSYVGMKGAAVFAAGRLANRKKTIEKIEGELARRGVEDVDDRVYRRFTGQDLPDFTFDQSALVKRYVALGSAGYDTNLSEELRAEARRRAAELEPAARAEYQSDFEKANADYIAKHGSEAASVFFQSAFEAPQQYEQARRSAGPPRGQIKIGEHSIDITLLADADLSTFIHETGHFYTELLRDLASDTTLTGPGAAEVAQDFKLLMEWVGNAGEPITREQHEQIARGFEAYLMEGRAPSAGLRAAFARFRAWLVGLYKSFDNLQVFLSPDVRGVFDRLLASQEEIAAAEREQVHDGLSEALRAAGVPDNQLAAIVDAEAEARHAAEEYLTSKLIADVQREHSAVLEAERVRVRREVAQEVNQERDYVALAFLSRGTKPDGSFLPAELEPFKLSKQDLLAHYADRIPQLMARLRARFLYAKEGGVHPDVAAEILGYSSGDELLRSLLALPHRSATGRIEELTDERMKDEHPELLTPAELPVEAMKAVHNEKRAALHQKVLELLASDDLATLKGLVRRVTRRIAPAADIKAEAEAMVAGRRIRDIRPIEFQRAEQKAAKAAVDALLKGDIETAFDEKQRERLNHELYRAAAEAQETVTKIKDEVTALFQSDEKLADRRDLDLVNAARAIAASFGIGKTDQSPGEYLAAVEKYDPDTYETLRAMVDDAKSPGTGLAESTYGQIVAMREAIQSLWDLALRSRQIEIDGKRLDIKDVREQLEAGIRLRGLPDARRGYKRAVSDLEKTKLGLLGARAALRRVEHWVDAMDGGDPSGVFRRFVWNPISDAAARFRIDKRSQLERYLTIVKGIEAGLTYTPIEAPELEYTFRDKAELLGAVLHTGNESNFDKLTRGRGWDPASFRAFLRRAQESGLLTKADYDYAQGVWDLFEDMKAGAQKAHRAMYGRYFDEITRNPVQTIWGEYAGGYMPARVDPFIVTDAAVRAEKESLEQGGNSFMFPSTGRGFTKSRIDEYARPLWLDLRMVPAHIDAALRFTHIQPHVKDVGRLVMHREFRSVLDAFDPAAGSDMLVPWLQRAATQRVEKPAEGWGGRFIANAARELRRRTGMQIMVGNVTNALQQFTGLSIAAVKVESRYLRSAMWEYLRAPKALAAAVAEKSDFMKTRLSAQVIEIEATIDDLVLNPSKYEQAREFARRHGYFLQAGTQNIVDNVAWWGAYERAIEGDVTELEAVRQADAVVRLTQGSFAPEDISRFEAGTAVSRLFTMFYSYFNMQANLLGTEFSRTIEDLGFRKGAGRLFYVYTLGFMIPAVVSELIVQAMAGSIHGDDDDGYLDDALNIFFGGQFRTATAMFPFVGPAVQAGINAFNSKWYDDRITTSPVVSAIESAVRAPYSIYKAIADGGNRRRAVLDVLTLVGLLTGLPVAGTLGRPLGYLASETESEGPLDTARGLITGKPRY